MIFENKTYKRFKKLHNYITDKDCSYTKVFNNVVYSYKTFKTKLGDRSVISNLLNNKDIMIAYHDKDDSLLFSLVINKRGKVDILYSAIDELAIYSAIYELECLISDNKLFKRDKILQKLFDVYPSTVQNGMLCYPLTYYK